MSKIEYSYVAYTNTRDMEDKIMNVKLKVANNDK